MKVLFETICLRENIEDLTENQAGKLLSDVQKAPQTEVKHTKAKITCFLFGARIVLNLLTLGENLSGNLQSAFRKMIRIQS